MNLSLSGKRAMVTGASSGLGMHFARVLAAAGAHVVLAARRLAALGEVASGILGQGGSCETVALDIRDQASLAALVPMLTGIDVVVNNAGLVRDAAALDQNAADWDEVIDTNLKGMFLLSQAVAKVMVAEGRAGSIINIASILGMRQAGGVVSYAVSKAGVIQLTKTLALEWARYGIRVNAIAPGYVETDLNDAFFGSEAGKALIRRIPQRRLGQLTDLDGPLLLLACEASAYMTGSVVTVDGGHLVSSL